MENPEEMKSGGSAARHRVASGVGDTYHRIAGAARIWMQRGFYHIFCTAKSFWPRHYLAAGGWASRGASGILKYSNDASLRCAGGGADKKHVRRYRLYNRDILYYRITHHAKA